MDSEFWILVGGPSHGESLWVKAGLSVIQVIPHDQQQFGRQTRKAAASSYEVVQYLGKDYVYNGRTFRVGDCNATPEQIAEIPMLLGKHYKHGRWPDF